MEGEGEERMGVRRVEGEGEERMCVRRGGRGGRGEDVCEEGRERRGCV